MLNVRVAEVQRNVLKQFGINTETVFSIGKFAFDFFNVNPFSLTRRPVTAEQPVLQRASPSGDDFAASIRAMERDGLLRTLAEPTLTAISGESAKFLAGGEFPIPVAADDDEVTIEFKPFGVGLGFTPVVMSEGPHSLRINTEVSELRTENAHCRRLRRTRLTTIPALKVRRAETTVELPSGGSMVMAGLIQERSSSTSTASPASRTCRSSARCSAAATSRPDETELVVIVTPYVVEPVNEKKLATPLDGFNIATDRQTILFGRLNKIYGAAGDSPKGVYHGNVGFIVE